MLNKLIGFYLSHTPRVLQWFSPALTRVLALGYRGEGVECPVCGKHYRELLPQDWNGTTHRNVVCPRCHSVGRFRFMELMLRSRGDFYRPGNKVLHVAPERCFVRKFEKAFGKDYITADLNSLAAKVRMNVENIPFPDDSFDVVLCNHVLEHVGDDRRAMGEIRRVLRPGGWAMLQVPIDTDRAVTYEDPSITLPRDRRIYFGQADHVRLHGRDYPDRLSQAGFRVEENRFADTLTGDQIALHALTPEKVVYICHKL
ncbi:MAG: methyltransferase domain-containing protein [Rikenellaceae bacterium]|nr:methyltransferase domain-containing protein [Rikenellaceae bacterium]